MLVDLDLVVCGESNGSVEPLCVRQEANLHEDALEVDLAVMAPVSTVTFERLRS